ncbi:MAG: type II toxin-antitoxin system VapC family toxin [Egibacteraceae bacterium]
MLLFDVNILVYAHRSERPEHGPIADWLTGVANAEQAFGVADLVLSGFLRIVTNPRIFEVPTPLPTALAFARELRSRPNRVDVRPGPRHWELFTSLCERAGVKGNLVPDAYLAALAIESGSEWFTTDRDFARFPGLRWRHPLDSTG